MKESGNTKKSEESTPGRRRSFLAVKQGGLSATDAHSHSAAEEDEDFPVLTEVVLAETEGEIETPSLPEPEPSSSPDPTPSPVVPLDFPDIARNSSEEFVAQMVQAINKQLSYELPSLVEATLVSISDELRAGIMSTMDAAIRDFIAGQRDSKKNGGS